MNRLPRQFQPTHPPLRQSYPILIFGLLTIGASFGVIREGAIAPFLVSLGMMLLASWVYYRLRILGSPTLDVDSKGLVYRVGRREWRARWAEIADMQWDFYRDQISFVRNDGQPPIRVSIDMTTRSGERFDMLFEDYWKPPKGSRKR